MQQKTDTVTIPTGATGIMATGLELGQARAARITMPATWVAAVLTFQVSYDGTNYSDLYDQYGNEYTVQAAQGRTVLLSPTDFASIRYLKIRSGTSASPVNQTADRALVVTSIFI